MNTDENPTTSKPKPVSKVACNWKLVHDYLKIKCPDEIAKLAASMAPKPAVFDANNLIKSALALQAEAEDEVIRLRTEVLNRMCKADIKSLAKKLDVPSLGDYNNNDYTCEFFDPVIGPLLCRFSQLQRDAKDASQQIQELDADNKSLEDLETAFFQTDLLNRSKPSARGRRRKTELSPTDLETVVDYELVVARPVWPCSLEKALRYAVDAADAPWSALEAAFRDFVFVNISLDRREQIEIPQRRLQQELELIEGHNESFGDSESFQREIERIKKELEKIETIRNLKESFVPGMKIPSDFTEKAALDYSYYADGINMDLSAAGIMHTLLTNGFRAFWNEYGAIYERIANDVNKVFSEGPKKRDHKLWLKRTNGFIQSEPFKVFLTKKSAQHTPGIFGDVAEAYLSDASDAKDNRTKRKVRKFLLTLFTHRYKKASPSMIKGIKTILENSAIKSIDDRTILECHALLAAQFGL